MGRHNTDNRSVGAVGITGKLLGLLGSESAYLKVIVLYGVVVSLLALAVPFAIQILINLLVIGGLFHPVVTATAVTFGLLVVSGGLYLVQVWMAEKLKRRVFVRFSSLIVLRVLNTSKSTWSQLFPSNIGDRFFEIPVIQKTLAKIAVSGSTFGLQMFVGLVVLAVYHPVFILFDLLLLGTMYFTVRTFYQAGLATAFNESDHKYDVAGWVQDMISQPEKFSSDNARIGGIRRLDAKIKDYLAARHGHFRVVYLQTLILVAAHVVLSVLLFGVGGYLVFQGQLTLGQLVAAEIIVSGILWGLRGSGELFESLYDLMAALKKLSLFSDLQPEQPTELSEKHNVMPELQFDDVRLSTSQTGLSFSLNDNEVILVRGTSGQLREVRSFLEQAERPPSGQVLAKGIEIHRFHPLDLGNILMIPKLPPLVGDCLRSSLSSWSSSVPDGAMLEAFNVVGLKDWFDELPSGLDTSIRDLAGISMEVELKLALVRCLVLDPKVIVLSHAFDLLQFNDLVDLVTGCCKRYGLKFLILSSATADQVKVVEGRWKLLPVVGQSEKSGRSGVVA